jgi:hypothetical protein
MFIIKSEPLMSDQTIHYQKITEISRENFPEDVRPHYTTLMLVSN